MYWNLGRYTPAAIAAMNKLHITGLPSEINDQQLREVFEQVGPVISAKIIRDANGRCIGLGIVQMRHVQDVKEILTSLDRIGIGGIRPHIWRPRSIAELIHSSPDGVHVNFCDPSWYAYELVSGHLRWSFKFATQHAADLFV